jgi:hypothetical protein
VKDLATKLLHSIMHAGAESRVDSNLASGPMSAVTDAICLPARAVFQAANLPDGNSVSAL